MPSMYWEQSSTPLGPGGLLRVKVRRSQAWSDAYARTINVADLELRLDNIERKLKKLYLPSRRSLKNADGSKFTTTNLET